MLEVIIVIGLFLLALNTLVIFGVIYYWALEYTACKTKRHNKLFMFHNKEGK